MSTVLAMEPGQQVLHYVIRRRLGGGGQGTVFEAWDTRLRRSVALKYLDAGGDHPPLLDEARASSRVRHPAIVTVHDVVEHDGGGFIVMDLIEGQTLSDVAPSLAQATRWLGEAAEALAEAHAQGVIHGDLKPGNLMIDNRGALRILDFGVSRMVDPLATNTSDTLAPPVGTLAYMAPEQLLGAPSSPASDIYALGLVFWELLSGRRPFDETDNLQMAKRKLHDDPVLEAAELPAGLVALLRSMVDRRPERRPADMAAVVASLRQLAAPAPVPTPAKPQRAGSVPSRLLRLGRLLLALALISLLALDTGPLTPTPRDLQQAETLLKRYDDDEAQARALRLLEATLARDPDNAWAAASLAVAYCLRYASDALDPVWLQKAEASAQLALRTEDQLALAHTARAWVHESTGRYTEAEAEYDKALVLDPTDFHGLNGYAQLLLRLNRHEEARQVLERALKRYPDEPVFLNALGTLHFQRGETDAAEPLFRAALRSRPDTALAYANLSAVLLRQNRGEEGLAVLQAGLRQRPDGRLYSNLGVLLFERGRYIEAAEAFRHALSGSKGNPNHYLKWANLADALILIPGREKEARAAYRHALDAMPPADAEAETTILSRAGLYAARLGEADRAETLTRAALARAPDLPDVLFRAALAWEISGRRDDALDALKSALKAGYPRQAIASEPALASLRRDLRYHRLLMEEKP